MFRTVQGRSEELDKEGRQKLIAYFWMVCDNRSCGVVARGDIPHRTELPQDAKVAELSEQWLNDFVAQARTSGWMIGLDAQFCPTHAKALMTEARRQEEALRKEPSPLVQIASPAEVSRAMRNLKAGKVGSN